MISVERVRAVWQQAAAYPANKEAVYPEHGAVQEFDLYHDKKVLEYGCGGGADAMSYLRRGNTVWYVDIVPANVEAARRRIEQAGLNQHAYGLVIDESARVPIASGYFDIVSSHGVLHHIEDPGPVVREFHRLLRPGALLYVMLYTEHLREHFAATVRDYMQVDRVSEAEAFAWCTDGRGVPYARAYTEAEGRALLEWGGCEVLRATEFNTRFFRGFKARRVS